MKSDAKHEVLVLAYAGCQTCKNAIKWLKERDIAHTVRSIVDEPPTARELEEWIPASKASVRKWLNTSGQSYRAIGKAKIDSSSDAQIAKLLTQDGKLVKRPVLVRGRTVLVGFKPDAYEALLG